VYNGSALIVRSWDGTTLSNMGTTFNDEYTTPGTGNVPAARLIAVHQSYVWVADTLESATRYGTRVRFSHFNNAENWATDDYFDIDPYDSDDHITALVPFQNMLLVFKHRSVHAVYGYDRDTFVVERLVDNAGCATQEAISASAGVCYWVSHDGNVYAFNGKGVVPIGSRIASIFQRDLLTPGASHLALWTGEGLHVVLLLSDGSRRWFYYAPGVGSSGAWTEFMYGAAELRPHSMVWWRKPTGAVEVLLTDSTQTRPLLFDDPDGVYDSLEESTTTRINGWWVSHWMDGKKPMLRKRFRRGRLVAASGGSTALRVEVYRDYDENTVHKAFTVPIVSVADSGTQWGDDWGDIVWASDNETYSFERLSSSGACYAIAYRICPCPSAAPDVWWVDSLTVPFKTKQFKLS
jgi:hypothetical protein